MPLPAPPQPTALRLSLRTWLLGLSLLTTMPLMVFALSAVWEFRAFQQRTLADQLDRRSNELALAVTERLYSTLATLNALAESDAALALEIPQLYGHAKRVVAREPDILAIALVTQDRPLFITSAPLDSTEQTPVPAADRVRAALRTQSPNVSGPFPSPVNTALVVALTLPLAREDESTYALRGILAVESLNRLVAAERLPPGWIAGIVDAEGTVIARSHDPALYVGRPTSASFRQGMVVLGKPAPFEGFTLEGTPTMHLVRPVFGFDWYLGLAVPRTILNAPLTDMLWHMAGLGVLWVGLSLLAAIAFSHYLLRQMKMVARTMNGTSDATRPETPLRVAELASIVAQFGFAQRAEAAMRGDRDVAVIAREQVQDLYDHAPCGYHSLDPQGRVLRMNETELRWLGLSLAQVQGRAYTDFLTPASQQLFQERFALFLSEGRVKDLEMELQAASGVSMPVLVSATAIRDAKGHFAASRSTVFDNTEKKKVQAQLEHMARCDALTELSNRRDFYEKAAHEIARSRRSALPFCVLMLDVDHVKKVNDQHGHAGGDDVLRQLARLLVAQLRTVDTPARLGGEEFAVLMPGAPLADAAHAAERLRSALQASAVVLNNGQEIHVTVSIGLTEWHAGDADIEATLQRADAALYRAKATGRNRVCIGD